MENRAPSSRLRSGGLGGIRGSRGNLAEPLLGQEKKASAGGCKTLSTQNASGWLQAGQSTLKAKTLKDC